MFSSISQTLRLPRVCSLCSLYHKNNAPLCEDCYRLLIPITASCTSCALPFNAPSLLLCSACQKRRPTYDKVFCSYQFEEPLRTLIHQFKYKNGLYLRKFLTNLMLDSVKDKSAIELGLLVPVPMHFKRIQERGFNHAAILTKRIAKARGLPYNLRLIQKIENTPTQASLSRLERQHNVRNKFVANQFKVPIITLIDDLMTTGSTAEELSQLLKNTYPCQVNIWCLARTPEHQ